jgi:CcmD family protein
MEHFGYLFAAYTIIFAVIFIYVVFIWRRQVALDAEVARLEARLKSLAPKSEGGGAEARDDAPAQL